MSPEPKFILPLHAANERAMRYPRWERHVSNTCASLMRGQDTDRNMGMAFVLVVENEALIRISAVHMMEDAGFAAMEACNADEAIEILDARSDIRVVFTDLNMSGSMDGLRLAHAIRERWPPIHIIVASGWDIPTADQLPANGRFIRKPYAAGQVSAVLQELVGPNPGPYQFMSHTGRYYSPMG
jgi:CheY-like chemotaxis protein